MFDLELFLLCGEEESTSGIWASIYIRGITWGALGPSGSLKGRQKRRKRKGKEEREKGEKRGKEREKERRGDILQFCTRTPKLMAHRCATSWIRPCTCMCGFKLGKI